MKFSIVTISFNQARFLEQAIRSVVEQDYPDVEYIIVDPGSTDGSREIIERYRDKITKVIFDPDNGPADGLNKGFGHAAGDIYGYINADDFFEPGAFSRAAKLFQERPEIDVVIGAIKIVDGKGHAKWRKRMSDKFDLKRYADERCWIGQQATFFRRTAYEKSRPFNVENNSCWDVELLVDMALNGCNFGRIYKILGNFRIHKYSISGSGRLREIYIKDQERIKKRIYDTISPSSSAYFNELLRLSYKFNPRRQLANYFVK